MTTWNVHRRRTAACALAAWLLLGPAVFAEGHPDGHHPSPPGRTMKTAPPGIADVSVLDQDGQAHRFYSDLVKGRIVAINFIYTECGTACPLLGVAFSHLQEELGARLGAEVSLISVTVDPARDTPARLAQWAAKYGARPGWTVVTGKTPDIAQLLRSLGSTTGAREEHATMVLIGDDAAGRWTRAYGLLSGAELFRRVVALSERRAAVRAPDSARR